MEYHSDFSSVSRSMLNVFCGSPRAYYETFVARAMQPAQSTKQMIVGSACHAALLEGKDLDEVVAEYPSYCFKSNGSLNPTPARAFEETIRPLLALKQADYQACLDTLEAVRKSALAGVIASSIAMEKRHDALLDGVMCKCKPDIECDMGHYILAYDLKFSDNVHPARFRSTAKRLRYWLQDAHYSRVLSVVHGKPVVFRFFCVEIRYPYRIQPYWYDERSREIAFDAHKAKLKELKECIDSGVFDDRWPNEITISPWELEQDEQLVEFDGE